MSLSFEAAPLSARPAGQRTVSFAAGLALLLIAMSAALATHGTRMPALALVGGGIGFVLTKANFGFAGSFRAALQWGDFSAFRAQSVSLAISTLLLFPLLAWSDAAGLGFGGYGSSIGIGFAVGAVLFGVGMHIGGGCASGTLYLLGSGDGTLLVTLFLFLIGSAFGAATLHAWTWLPAFPATTSQAQLGWVPALVLHLASFALLYRFLPRHPTTPEPPWPRVRDLARERWPLLLGAVGLALLNASKMALSGYPWGETTGFTLWGSKVALALGFDPASWAYWRDGADALHVSVFADVTSVMDMGIIAGAALAASLGHAFDLRFYVPLPRLAGAALGGLLMGYGARLSGGCNIGAYFSALASGSLSGWARVLFAFAGSWLGLRLKAKIVR
jgi:uncharacterized membrane protein YedE/YeeE